MHKTGKATRYGIKFYGDKAQLHPDSQTILQPVRKLLQCEPALKLEIQVHSAKGTQQSYSRKLSVERARTIQQWLLQHGVEQARLLARGYEDSVPVRDNMTDEGFALNRRVVLVPIP
jgi:outer membrane protein OmpA-like peptidoglycan-associated protein